jgi:hypothetical protein
MKSANEVHSLTVEHRTRNRRDSEIKPAGEWHSRTVECRERKSSEQRNKASKGGALTPYRAQSERVVRTVKQS